MDLDALAKDFLGQKLRNKTWTRVWQEFMCKYKCEYVCELGISRGTNFYEMIKSKPKLAVAVDSWINDGVVSRNDSKYPQEALQKQYEEFVDNVKDNPFVKVYREYTFDAVKHFADNYFDIVYVDADHSYKGVMQDLEDWYPKVKKGKFLLGDDYRHYQGRHRDIKYGVIEAVNDFAKKKKLRLFEMRRGGWGFVKE